MSTSPAEVIAKMTARAEQIPTQTLCEALTVLEAKPKLDEAERMTRTVLMDVLCERHPEANAAFDAWASEEAAYMATTAVEAITGAALAAGKAATP